MENFEWNDNKRLSNVEKHGIDFLDAIEVFSDPDRIELESPREQEVRVQTIGKLNAGLIILVVWVYRHKKKRIISARCASRKERSIYIELGGSDEE